MNAIATRQNRCRFCREPLPNPFLHLGTQPLANNLCDGGFHTDPRVELALTQCGVCGLVQSTFVVDPKILFDHYLYTPSQSATFRRHFETLADDLARLPKGLAIDIGSNDGLLLSYLQRRGFTALGIEPARNLVAQARERGIPTIGTFWSERMVDELVTKYGRAAVITATNVFAHNDDAHGFLNAVKKALREDGTFVIEVPDLDRMLEDGTYDLCYHEHLSYFDRDTITSLLLDHGLAAVEIDDVPIHGGSLRVWARHVEHVRSRGLKYALPTGPSQARARACLELARKAKETRVELWTAVRRARTGGLEVVGYGAPAKATVLISYCGFGPADIEWIAEDSPLKQGRFVPGCHVPIRPYTPPKVADRPRAYIIFPWNVAGDIRAKLHLRPGDRIIVPMPSVTVEEVREGKVEGSTLPA